MVARHIRDQRARRRGGPSLRSREFTGLGELESRVLLSIVYWTGGSGEPQQNFDNVTLSNTFIEIPAGADLHLSGNLTLENCTLQVDTGAKVTWDGGLLPLAGTTLFSNYGTVNWRGDMTLRGVAFFDNEGKFDWNDGCLTNYAS